MEFDLPLVWAAIIGFGVFMYVFMDGFDLGVGILFPLAPGKESRDLIMTSVAPVWDANETWLVLGGAGLLAAFPLAYAIILSALYIPLTVMLLALIFRGVAFEFRFKADRSEHWWDAAFHLGSLLATLCQGLVLGAFIQGFETAGRDYAGGAWDWLSPFALMTAGGLVGGYALLGCGWIILKTEGELRSWAYRMARPLLLAVLGFIAVVSIWTPLLDAQIAERWFSWPNILYLSPVPLATAALAITLHLAVARRWDAVPFLCTLGVFLLCYLGLAISLWPKAVPPHLTIWDVASAPASQAFLLVGTAIVIPCILFYTAYSYYVFRGKVSRELGYH